MVYDTRVLSGCSGSLPASSRSQEAQGAYRRSSLLIPAQDGIGTTVITVIKRTFKTHSRERVREGCIVLTISYKPDPVHDADC